MRIRCRLVLAACSALMFTAACGSADMADRLDGRTFVSNSVSGHELVPDSTITLEFADDGRIALDAGCNHLMGKPRLDDDRIVVDQLASTEMACKQALMKQDRWLSDLLESGLDAELDGDELTLSNDDVQLEFTDRSDAESD